MSKVIERKSQKSPCTANYHERNRASLSPLPRSFTRILEFCIPKNILFAALVLLDIGLIYLKIVQEH